MSADQDRARTARIRARRGQYCTVEQYLSARRSEEYRRALANRLPWRRLAPGEVLTEGHSHDLGHKPNVTLLSDFARGIRALPGRGRKGE